MPREKARIRGLTYMEQLLIHPEATLRTKNPIQRLDCSTFAQAILKQRKTTESYVSPAELAILHAAIGEREHAFASLERAYAACDLQLLNVGVDPRFQDLLRRVGLPQ